LGAILAAEMKFAEAEQLLLSGYERVKQHQELALAGERPDLTQALERLIHLYQAMNQPKKRRYGSNSSMSCGRRSRTHTPHKRPPGTNETHRPELGTDASFTLRQASQGRQTARKNSAAELMETWIVIFEVVPTSMLVEIEVHADKSGEP